MDKGQHLRLVIVEGSGTTTTKVVALSTDMTLHLSAQTEDSSTKDTTDTNGSWNEYDVTQRSGDISFNALVGVGTDAGGKSFADFIDQVSDSLMNDVVFLQKMRFHATYLLLIPSHTVPFSNQELTFILAFDRLENIELDCGRILF